MNQRSRQNGHRFEITPLMEGRPKDRAQLRGSGGIW